MRHTGLVWGTGTGATRDVCCDIRSHRPHRARRRLRSRLRRPCYVRGALPTRGDGRSSHLLGVACGVPSTVPRPAVDEGDEGVDLRVVAVRGVDVDRRKAWLRAGRSRRSRPSSSSTLASACAVRDEARSSTRCRATAASVWHCTTHRCARSENGSRFGAHTLSWNAASATTVTPARTSVAHDVEEHAAGCER